VSSSWLARLAFQVLRLKFFTGLLGFASPCVISLYSSSEFFLAQGGLYVLHANVQALLNNALFNTLVNKNANGARGNVPNNTSFAVVESVGHTSVFRSYGLNVNIVSKFVGPEISG